MQSSPGRASFNRLTLQLKLLIGSIYFRVPRPPRQRFGPHLPMRDALLLATAGEAGCRIILTEDLADGADLAGVRIRNPFSPTGGLTEQARVLLGLASP